MKTVLILGAGRGQMPIYEVSKKMGCKVVFVTPQGNYPGIGKEEVRYADVMDYESVYKIAKEVHADAVISDQLDAGIFSCAYASEKLGLVGIGTTVAKKFTDKYEMLKAARDAGINVPDFIGVKNIDELNQLKDKIKYPAVMKPSDNASSRGVILVDNFDDVLKNFDDSLKYSKEKMVVIESFIRGKEYVVEAYTKDYQVTSLIVGHRDYFNIPKKFIPSATVFRDTAIADSNIEKKLLEYNEKIIKCYGLPFGITHGEFIFNDEDKKVYLVEIAARGGGEFISGDLIPLACGIHANELLVKHVLGIKYDIPTERKKSASAYFSYLLPEGKIVEINGITEAEKIPGVHKLMFDNIKLGMDIPVIRDKASRKGPLLVYGNSKDECYDIKRKIFETISIKVENNGKYKDLIWDDLNNN